MVSQKTGRIVLTVAAVGAVAATGAYLYWQRFGYKANPSDDAAPVCTLTAADTDPADSKASKKKKKRRRKKKVLVPDDLILCNELSLSIERFQQTAIADGEKELQIVDWLRNMDLPKYKTKTRLLAAQWLIFYQTMRALNRTQDAIDDSAMFTEIRDDMLLTWKILDCETSSITEQRSLDVLMLDVAQRLRHFEKILPVYERIISRGTSMTNEELMVCFSVAPLLGRWDDTRMLGSRFEKAGHSLKEFHEAALQRPEIPDYEILYNIAEAEAKYCSEHGQPKLEGKVYKVTAFKMQYRNVECADQAKREEIVSSMEPNWIEAVLDPNTRLCRHGAVGLMQSTSGVRLSMVGPWRESSLRLEGYADLNSSATPDMASVRQREVYEFPQLSSDMSILEGTYHLIQNCTQASGEELNITLTFDLKVCLEVDEALST